MHAQPFEQAGAEVGEGAGATVAGARAGHGDESGDRAVGAGRFGLEGRLALDNTVRSPKRTATTVPSTW